MQWNGTTQTSGRIGFWFKATALPTAEARIADLRETSTSGTVGGLLFMADGRIRIMQATTGLSTGQSAPLSTNTWYWVSLGWNATAKTARMVIYSATGTLVHDSASVALTTAYASFATARFGHITAVAYGTAQWDDIQFDQGSATPLDPWLP
jgi:hypothetical protein